MKVVEWIFEKLLRNVVKLDDIQMRFMHGKGTVDTIFILWQMLEKYEIARRKLYVVFNDLKKSFWSCPKKGDLVGIEKKRCDTDRSVVDGAFFRV